MQAVAVRPVVVAMQVVDGFQTLGGGVWQASRCRYPRGPPTDAGAVYDHSVLVVGYNMSARPPYWIIKNSWGDG